MSSHFREKADNENFIAEDDGAATRETISARMYHKALARAMAISRAMGE